MLGIAQKVLAAPEKYSVDMLRRAIETGLLPAYIGIPLIQSKAQMQQQMQRVASLQQPDPDQQPTVAEEILAQPGVDALPSNLPQEYAGGGIVAFSDGGLSQEERDRANMLRTLRFMGAGAYDVLSLPVRGVAGAAESVITRPLRAVGVPVPYLPESFYGGDRSSAFPMLSRMLGSGEPSATTAPTATTPAAPPLPAPAPISAPRPQGPSGMPRAATPATPAAPGIVGLTEKLPELKMPAGPSAVESARELFGQAREEAENIGRSTDERIRAARGLMQGEAFEGYKKQLEEEARKAGADRADAKNMALFKAGLAMMAGTSRHALENIGKGALTGVEDFQTAARELRKADKERQKEFALIEQARRAEKAGNIRDEMQLLQRAEDRNLKGLYSLTNAISAATGADRGEAVNAALTVFAQGNQNYRTAVEQAGATQRTNAQIAGGIRQAEIGAGATMAAAQARAAGRPEIPAATRERITREVENMRPDVEKQVLKELGFKSPPPSNNVLAQREYQQRVQTAMQQLLDRRFAMVSTGQIPDMTPGQSANRFSGYSLESIAR